jgi:hypothetical protein
MKKTLFVKVAQNLAEEYALRLEAMARAMEPINQFGRFCETYRLSPCVQVLDIGEVSMLALGGHQAAPAELLAKLKQDDYMVITRPPVDTDRHPESIRVRCSVSRGGFACELHYYAQREPALAN